MQHNKGNDDKLTSRELEVLELMAEGFSHKEVAEKLYVSPETIRKHLSNIYGKLKVNNKIAAINKVWNN